MTTAPLKKFRGFTLIELLIVIAIMGILAAAVLVAVNPLKRQQQARDSGRKSDVGQIATALQAWSTSPGQGNYPSNGGGTNGVASTVLTALTASDLKRVPDDPSGGAVHYTYTANSATPGDSAVYAALEAPTGAAGSIWCWRSSTGIASEMTGAAACTAP
ncbi:type II secretion system protein [Candidatus Curtissbacteria bacterium]|nr:type II secretion system protein [Candidatus Curtissbacteria bacterium]